MSFVFAGILAAFISCAVMGVLAILLGVIFKDIFNPLTWLYSWHFSVVGIFLAYIITLIAHVYF